MLRWLQSGHASAARAVEPTGDVDEQACPGLARALKTILAKTEQPEVLDLGQSSSSAAIYLAKRGARVHVEHFAPPPQTPKRAPAEGAEAAVPLKEPVVIPQPDAKFDLVLTWEHPDFVPPDRLADFAAELRRVLVPGGWVLMYSQDQPTAASAREEPVACYRLTADDRIVRLSGGGPTRPRWSHNNRTIERALEPLRVQSIHLQRNRIREVLLRKPERRP